MGRIFSVFFVRFFPSNAHGLMQVRGHLASCTSLLVMRQGRGSGSTEAVFAFREKKPLYTGVRTGCHYLTSLSVRLCVTFVVFTDCTSCTRPISTNPASTETDEYGLTLRMRFIARRFEVVAVAGLLGISWCVLGAAGFRFFFRFFSSNAHGLLQV